MNGNVNLIIVNAPHNNNNCIWTTIVGHRMCAKTYDRMPIAKGFITRNECWYNDRAVRQSVEPTVLQAPLAGRP